MLNIKQIQKTIKDKTILHNVSLTVQPGEIAVLLGASGVGKSTLLRVLNHLESIDAGTITLNSTPLTAENTHQQHTVGMVFQHFNLFEHLTVEQNITLALEKVLKKPSQEAHKIAQVLLHNYGLADKASCMVTQLSGGQKQRLAIARTVALQPKIICFDEPTSALDPLFTTQIATMLTALAAQGYIILVATHDIKLVEKLPCTLYLMQAGTIVESASSQEFFAHKNSNPALDAFMNGINH